MIKENIFPKFASFDTPSEGLKKLDGSQHSNTVLIHGDFVRKASKNNYSTLLEILITHGMMFPTVIKVNQVGYDGGNKLYYEMDYFINQDTLPSFEQFYRLLRTIEFFRFHNISHNDFKTKNCVSNDKDMRIIDFEISSVLDDLKDGRKAGTPDYRIKISDGNQFSEDLYAVFEMILRNEALNDEKQFLETIRYGKIQISNDCKELINKKYNDRIQYNNTIEGLLGQMIEYFEKSKNRNMIVAFNDDLSDYFSMKRAQKAGFFDINLVNNYYKSSMSYDEMASFDLGLLFEKGQSYQEHRLYTSKFKYGIDADLRLSAAFYRRAKNLGHPEAKEKIKGLIQNNKDCSYKLGQVYEGLLLFDKAESEYQKANNIDSIVYRCLYLIRRFRKEPFYEECFKVLKHASDVFFHQQASYQVANIFFAYGNQSEAYKYYQRCRIPTESMRYTLDLFHNKIGEVEIMFLNNIGRELMSEKLFWE